MFAMLFLLCRAERDKQYPVQFLWGLVTCRILPSYGFFKKTSQTNLASSKLKKLVFSPLHLLHALFMEVSPENLLNCLCYPSTWPG